MASAFAPDTLARLDGEELTLIVPLVECGVLIETLVTLQPDQFGAMHCSERFRNFGLADARFPFEQQRTLQKIHQPQRSRDVVIGDIADGGQPVRDIVAVQGHAASHYIDMRRRDCSDAAKIRSAVPTH